jgi:hypothetical protein
LEPQQNEIDSLKPKVSENIQRLWKLLFDNPSVFHPLPPIINKTVASKDGKQYSLKDYLIEDPDKCFRKGFEEMQNNVIEGNRIPECMFFWGMKELFYVLSKQMN